MFGQCQEPNVVQQCGIVQVAALILRKSKLLCQQEGVVRSAFPMPEVPGDDGFDLSSQAP
jgi:hypothetical protein